MVTLRVYLAPFDLKDGFKTPQNNQLNHLLFCYDEISLKLVNGCVVNVFIV